MVKLAHVLEEDDLLLHAKQTHGMECNCSGVLGNPTRSIKVNELIKTVKKKEVQKEGKASTAR